MEQDRSVPAGTPDADPSTETGSAAERTAPPLPRRQPPQQGEPAPPLPRRRPSDQGEPGPTPPLPRRRPGRSPGAGAPDLRVGGPLGREPAPEPPAPRHPPLDQGRPPPPPPPDDDADPSPGPPAADPEAGEAFGPPDGVPPPGAGTVVVAPIGPRRRRSRTARALRAVLVLTVLLAVAGVAGVGLVNRQVMNNVERIPNVFAPLDEAERPTKPAGTDKTLNVLLVGLDTGVGGQSASSDAIMLLHVAADRRTASLVSIPRNTWVAVPDRGPDTISRVYAAGGPSLLVRTVERLTALRLDHFAVVDFAGFKDITDAVGGVDVRVGPAAGGALPAGVHHLDGDAALRYVRQRDRLPGGDLDRVRQQQEVMKALLTKVGAVGLRSNPVRTLDVLDSVTRAMSVDETLSSARMRSLALSLRNLRTDQVDFLTAPVGSVGRVGTQSVVRLDPGRAGALWAAIARDEVPEYVRGHPELRPVPG